MKKVIFKSEILLILEALWLIENNFAKPPLPPEKEGGGGGRRMEMKIAGKVLKLPAAILNPVCYCFY